MLSRRVRRGSLPCADVVAGLLGLPGSCAVAAGAAAAGSHAGAAWVSPAAERGLIGSSAAMAADGDAADAEAAAATAAALPSMLARRGEIRTADGNAGAA